MKITIAAIGRQKKDSPAGQLYAEYMKRLPWKVTLKELEEKNTGNTAQRKALEGAWLLEMCNASEKLIALDERGRDMTSEELARQIGAWQQEGIHSLAFVIGGQDGLDESVRKAAAMTLSLGKLTWPHMLARSLLAEQLYRAHTILTGHPYHRH